MHIKICKLMIKCATKFKVKIPNLSFFFKSHIPTK